MPMQELISLGDSIRDALANHNRTEECLEANAHLAAQQVAAQQHSPQREDLAMAGGEASRLQGDAAARALARIRADLEDDEDDEGDMDPLTRWLLLHTSLAAMGVYAESRLSTEARASSGFNYDGFFRGFCKLAEKVVTVSYIVTVSLVR
jgi:hypothetical protein